MKKKTTEKRGRNEFSTKNVIEEWNNLSIVKKIGCMVLVVCLWMLIVDEWIGIGDIFETLW